MKQGCHVFWIIWFVCGEILPQQPEVVLFENKDFKGRFDTFQQSDPDLSDNIIGLHQASSIRIPLGLMVYLYEGAHYQGRFIVLYENESNLGQTQLGNDRVASIKIEKTSKGVEKSEVGVILYSQINYAGQSEVFFKNTSNLQDTSFGNDKLASIKISKGLKVTLFEHADYKGQAECFYSDDSNLGDNTIGVGSVSSLKIEPFAPGLTDGETRKPVILYKDVRFRGVGEPFFEDDPDLGDNAIGGKTIGPVQIPTGAQVRSVQIPAGARVQLFTRKDYQGKSATLLNDQWDLSQTKLGKNRVGSIKVIYRNEIIKQKLQGQNVCLYTEPFFRGTMEEVATDIRTLKDHKVGNDSVMSVYVPSGMQITLFSDKDFSGMAETLSESDPDLFDNTIGGRSVTSLKIVRQKTPPGNRSGSLTANLVVTPWPGGKMGAMFDASGTRIPDGLTARYELDYDGDRYWDYSETFPPQIEFAFSNPGSFTAYMKISTSNGQTTTISRDYTISSNAAPKTVQRATPVERSSNLSPEEERRLAKEEYDRAYAHMSNLMAEGKGETPEAQLAYNAYQEAKARYERSLK